jgi:hypothetical protein
MKTITFYVVAALCLLATKLNAQETFEERVAGIATNIERITKEQKDSLKIEVEQVNQMLDKKEISSEEAAKRKEDLANKRAEKIEKLVEVEEDKLNELVKDKVEGKLTEGGDKKFTFKFGQGDSIKKAERSYRRTTSQFVFAFGVNRLVTDDKIDNDNFKWRSDFYEWGVSWNTRVFKNNNLLHLKYGLSLQYNNLRPENNRMFETTEDGQTILVDAGRDLELSRLRYVNLVVPMHLEFDFTKKQTSDDRVYYPSHKSVRLGLGGYAGLNVKEKQILRYEDNGHDVKQKQKGDFNVNDFVYGVSAYLGYGEVSLYAKYDLQPVFQNNAVDSNNLSLGIRFDFN